MPRFFYELQFAEIRILAKGVTEDGWVTILQFKIIPDLLTVFELHIRFERQVNKFHVERFIHAAHAQPGCYFCGTEDHKCDLFHPFAEEIGDRLMRHPSIRLQLLF